MKGDFNAYSLLTRCALALTLLIASTVSATAADRLYSGQSLSAGQSLVSSNGRYRLVLQGDGNLVIYTAGRAIWHTHTYGTSANKLAMQSDGNLVLYRYSTPKWHTHTYNYRNQGVRAVLQNDGNFVLYTSAWKAIWASKGLAAAAPAKVAGEFNVTVKSFIKPVDLTNIGFLPFPGFLDPIATAKLSAFAVVTKATFRENPWHTRKDEGYRFYSNLRINAECTGANLRITRGLLTADSGKDAGQKADAPIGQKELKMVGNEYRFKWYLRAKPTAAAQAALLAVWPRTNPYIWHKMGGKVICNNGRPKLITNLFEGSKFPTHRYWINDVAKHTKNQGQIAELWKLDRPSL